jgi:putative transposase
MSRLRRIAESDRIFFVTTNLAKGVRSLSPEERDLLVTVLDTLRTSLDFLVLGYIIMPDHAHLLISCKMVSVSTVMHQWKFKTGYTIQKVRGNHGSLWQSRYFDFICRRSRDVSDKLRYIHENPVAAGMSRHGHEWRWSSASHYAGTAVPPLVPDLMEFSGDPNELLWPAPWRPA